MAFKPLLFVLITVAFGSCAASIGSGSYSESEPSVPEPVVAAQKVVRPDRIDVPFVFAVVEEKDRARATELLRQGFDELVKRTATTPGATVRMRGVYGGDDKVSAFGSVELAVTEAQDFWTRARLAAGVEKALDEMELAGKKTKLRVNHEAARGTVADPETQRAELIKLVSKRLSEVVAAAATKGAPLHVTDCGMPGPVAEEAISFEEVGLSLELNCSIRSTEKD